MLTTLELYTLFSLDPKPELGKPDVSPLYDPSSVSFLEDIHRRKTDSLKEIIASQGWPSMASVVQNAEAAAFMIVQHADYDPALQRLCHSLLLESVALGRTTNLGFLAFITDRILCNAGQHQRFGTQIREVTNGCFVPKAMEDPEDVDSLRHQAGIDEKLFDYMQRINSGDLLLYRFVLNGFAEELEHVKETRVIPFPVHTD